MNNKLIKNKENEKGISLILSFFVMLVILTVVVSISALLFGEVKILRNVGNSVVAFYAADSGVEKVLYYDRQVLPVQDSGVACNPGECGLGQSCVDNKCLIPAKRGFCTLIGSYEGWFLEKGDYCLSDEDLNSEKSIFCNNPRNRSGTNCDPAVCSNCTIAFTSMLNKNLYFLESALSEKDVSYSTTATISPSGNTSTFQIDSKGTYLGESRKIHIQITTTQ